MINKGDSHSKISTNISVAKYKSFHLAHFSPLVVIIKKWYIKSGRWSLKISKQLSIYLK